MNPPVGYYNSIAVSMKGGDVLKQHSVSYEQYCWVKQINVVVEETIFHNGTKKIVCTSFAECGGSGGCKNSTLSEMWGKSIAFCGPDAGKCIFDN